MPGVPVELIQSVTPGTVQLAGKLVSPKFLGQFGGKVVRGAARLAGRWFRSKKPKLAAHPGIRTARGGSAITRGKLDLGGGQSFRAGGTSFNVRTAGKVAAVGVGGAVAVGKLVRPTAAVHVAMGRSTPAPRVDFSTPSHAPVSRSSTAARSSPAPRSSPSPASSSGRQRRCGCPAGQRMLCFKRKHNPEAEAKRRARRKAARAKSVAKTAKRHAKEKAAAGRRKAARSARGLRHAIRGRKR